MLCYRGPPSTTKPHHLLLPSQPHTHAHARATPFSPTQYIKLDMLQQAFASDGEDEEEEDEGNE